MKKNKSESSEIARNKKAYFDYEIIEDFEAGIMLKGYEVKAIRAGKVNLKGAHVVVLSDGPYVVDMHIGSYEQAGLKDYHPKAKRKLLLNKKEIEKIANAEATGGLAVLALAMYKKGGLIKLRIGVGKGKKKYDKRTELKRKSQDRDVARALKHYR